jgi:hypothetical protein
MQISALGKTLVNQVNDTAGLPKETALRCEIVVID